jgi:thiol:disulfide interchange protein DsbD
LTDVPQRSGGGPAWENYSPSRLADKLESGPAFVNFTAAWCITCKVNEAVALSSPAIASAFEEHGVSYLKGDWTNEDPQITEALAEYGRSGVPLYLLYEKGEKKAEVLPQILTETIVLDAIDGLPK